MENPIYFALPIYEPSSYEVTHIMTPFWSTEKEEAYAKAFAWIEKELSGEDEDDYGVLGWKLLPDGTTERVFLKDPYMDSPKASDPSRE